jgi:hypothetical protein
LLLLLSSSSSLPLSSLLSSAMMMMMISFDTFCYYISDYIPMCILTRRSKLWHQSSW